MSITVAEVEEKAAEIQPKRVAATTALGVFAGIGWVFGILSVALISVLSAVGYAAGVAWRAAAFCAVAVHYGFCKGAGVKSVKKEGPPAPPGPGIPPGTNPGTFPGTFLQ